MQQQPCPCGSQKTYRLCCADFHDGTRLPQTAEKLMRSRYSAFAIGNLTYLQQTMAGRAKEHAPENLDDTVWLGLDVQQSYADKSNPNRAFVEFRALYNHEGKVGILYELSEFMRIDGHWYYVDGIHKKTSRNDPCPCKSGKKFKKCHSISAESQS
ncbi:MAG: YchJ family protein [Pseudomonadota bacterium]|nr:YchJ family protein [Pseudomonadota bacterium]